MVWAVMSDPLGLSVGTTNLVAARVGNQPVTRRSMLTLAQSGGTISGFVERVGDRVPLVTPDGTSYLAEQLLVEALDVMVRAGRWAVVRRRDRGSRALESVDDMGVPECTGQQHEPVADQRAGPAGLRRRRRIDGAAGQPRISPSDGVVALLDFGGSGTSITLADAASAFEPIGETVALPGLLR